MPYFTGNNSLDSLLASFEPHWNGAGTFDQGAAVSFSFALPPVPGGFGGEQFAFNEVQEIAAILALQKWANVANITFNEVTDTGIFLGDSVSCGDINFVNQDMVGDFAVSLASAFFPFGPNPKLFETDGDVHVNVNFAENLSNLGEHSQGLSTLLHETGHALGLEHADEGLVIAPTDEATDRFTVMISNTGLAVFDANDFFATTPMINDILAIQHLYGPNNDFNSGDTTYIFNDSQITYETLWDGGGNDTIIYNGSRPATINLTPGTFSSVGLSPDGSGATAIDNLGIAFGATIENAVGGSAADLIIGNSAANGLFGGVGGDVLFGGVGDDFLQGNTGNDFLQGNQGNDTVRGGQGDDIVRGGKDNDVLFGGKGNDTIAGGDGSDTIFGGIAGFTGADNDSIVGRLGADLIQGNSGNDFLRGNQGDDTVRGGQGDDTVRGGQDNDVLFGGKGNDDVLGGKGNDVLFGGPDFDTFIFGDSSGQDVIGDFELNVDLIAIASNVNGSGILSEADALAQITTDAVGDAVFDLGGGNTVTLAGVDPSTISEADLLIF